MLYHRYHLHNVELLLDWKYDGQYNLMNMFYFFMNLSLAATEITMCCLNLVKYIGSGKMSVNWWPSFQDVDTFYETFITKAVF